MTNLWNIWSQSLPRSALMAALDILVTAFLIYQFLMIVRGRRAQRILTGLFMLAAIYLGAAAAGLELVRWGLETLAPYTVFALIVMFQSEIRRMLARIGQQEWLPWRGRLERRESTEEILLALEQLSLQKTGALIVVERTAELRTFVETGIAVDAALSRDLLLSIFQKGGAMHDGAVIVQGSRVAAASCFLPLSTRPAARGQLGARHRAAIGITEESDCLAVVVSEGSGRITIAEGGEFELDVSLERASERLSAEPLPAKRVEDRAAAAAPHTDRPGHEQAPSS